MKSEIHQYGRVEKIQDCKITGWIVDFDESSSDTIVDLYLGSFLVATARPTSMRKDVFEYFIKKELEIGTKDVQFEFDISDCPFGIIDDVLAYLDESIADTSNSASIFNVRLRRTGCNIRFAEQYPISHVELIGLRDLLSIRVKNIADYDPLWGRCIEMRQLLQRTGLWCGDPLTSKEMDNFRADPVGICVDAKFMDMQAQGNGEALHFYRTMSHRYPMRPNALFDDYWFVRHYSEACRAVSSGLCLSGLDFYLNLDKHTEHFPACWMKTSVDSETLLDIQKLTDLSSWVDVLATGDSPSKTDFLDALSISSRSGVHLALAEPRLSIREWVDLLLTNHVFHSAEEIEAYLGHPVQLDRVGDFDFLGFLHERTRIVLFNTNYKTRNLHITRSIIDDARRLVGRDNVIFATQTNLVKTCRDNSDAILVCIDGQRMNLALISRARRYAVSTILWTFDDPYNLKDHIAASDYFDLIFTNDSAATKHYGSKGIFMPLAAPSKYTNAEPAKKDYDIFFCGTAWPNRVVLLNRLMADRPEYRYKIALTYNPHVPAVPLDRSLTSYVKTLSYEDFLTYAGRSEITLALHRNFSGSDKLSVSSSPGPRMFEVAAAGSYQISESASKDFQTLFPEDTVDYFSNYESLLNSVDAALKNPNTTHQEKADRLSRRVAMRHTYMHRISTMLTETERLPSAPNYAVIKKARPRVLYVVHNTLKSKSFGGLEIHQDIIKENLSNDYDFFFFYSQIVDKQRKLFLTNSKYKILETRDLPESNLHGKLEQRDVEMAFSEFLNTYDFDGVHFFHFMHNSPSLSHIARAAAVPYVISIHDYYTVCRQFNMIDYKGRYCNNTFEKSDDCDVCLRKQYNFEAGAQILRRDYYLEILDNADLVIYVSDQTRKKYRELYPQLDFENKSAVHGAPIPNSLWRFRRMNQINRVRNVNESVKVVIFGNFSDNKGASYFIDAITADRKIDIDFHFHGETDEKSQQKIESLLGKQAIFHGRYKPGEVDVTNYEFSLHLSNWPETYCQTLSEAWAARLIPIVTDIGALGTRVIDNINGLKCDPDRPATLCRILRQISEQPETYLAMRDNISDDLFVTQEEQAEMYRKTYSSIFGITPAMGDMPLANSSYSMSDLQMDRRSPSWNHRKITHPDDKIALPSMNYHDQAKFIDIVEEDITFISPGKVDKIDLVDDANSTQNIPLQLKNDQMIHIEGWVSKPETYSDFDPIVLVREAQAKSFEPVAFELNSYNRNDLPGALGNDDARNWGIRGSIRLLNTKRFLSGDLTMHLGWRDKSCGKLTVLKKAETVNLKYGG